MVLGSWRSRVFAQSTTGELEAIYSVAQARAYVAAGCLGAGATAMAIIGEVSGHCKTSRD